MMHRGTLILCLAFLCGVQSFFVPQRIRPVDDDQPVLIQRPEIPSRHDLGSYFITAPNTFRFGSNLTVSVNIYHARTPVTVGLTLYSSRLPNIASELKTFRPGQPGNVTLQIPVLNNTDLTHHNFYLQAFGFGGLLFNSTKPIYSIQNKTTVFLQTDKKTYRPGQTVHYRIVCINDEFMPTPNQKIRTIIRDPRNHNIYATATRNCTDGFVTEEFPLIEQPTLGNYRIEVRNETTLLAVKFFRITKEVLPEFDVEVRTPDYIFADTKEIPVGILARYPLRQVVTGKYTIHCRIAPKRSYIFNERSPIYNFIFKQTKVTLNGTLTSNTTLKIDATQFSLLRALPKYYLPSLAVYMNVTVTDNTTGLVYNVTKRIPLYKEKIQATIISEPESYKPGMIYQIKVLLTTPDGKPIRRPESVKLDVVGMFSFKRTRTEYVSENSLYTITFTVPKYCNFFSYEITTTFNNETVLLTAKTPMKFVSPSNSYLQLRLLNSAPVPCNNKTLIRLDTTQYLYKKPVTLLLFSRGQLVHTNTTNITGFSTLFFVDITPEMSPLTTAVAFFIRSNGEIVNDIMTFNVRPTFRNNVTTTLNSNITTPGSTIEVRVKTTPNAKVGILGFDLKSIHARATNDITPRNVFDRLRPELPFHRNLNLETEEMLNRPLPLPRNFDAHTVFDQAQTLIFTDGKLFRSRSSLRTTHPLLSTPFENDREIDEEERQRKLQEDERDTFQKVVPETWLWMDTKANSNGEAVLLPEVPNSVNHWVLTTMSMSNTTGFGIAPKPTELLTFKHFYITTELPRSVIRGEKLTIRATLFNFYPTDITVSTSIDTSKDFTLDESTFLKQKTRVTVPAHKYIEVEYTIIPTTTGYIPIILTANSDDMYFYDFVEKHLLVEPQGVKQHTVQNLVIDLMTGSLEKTIPIRRPANVTAENTQINITFTGDLMRLSIENMGRLLENPRRCAEHNIVNMIAPVYLTRYLEKTQQSNPETEREARRLFMLAYQQQLKFLRPDGSFSPFGKKDRSGSLWLTAVISKTMTEARRNRLFPIDTSVITRSTVWLINQQQADGRFTEREFTPTMPINNLTLNQDITLTALISISLVHNLHYVSFAYNPLVKARTYLEKNLNEINDTYTAALVSYALVLSNSRLAPYSTRKLDEFATTENGNRFWKIQLNTTTNKTFNDLDSVEKSLTIQATSYALLTKMLTTSRVQEFIPISNWLIAQRNRLGGFVAAHDTCLAIKALSRFSLLTYRSRLDAHIIVFDANNYRAQETFSINRYNRNQTLTFSLPPQTKSITLSCFGTGFVYAQITTSVNVTKNTLPETSPKRTFDVQVQNQQTPTPENTRVCARLLQLPVSHPVVMEISIPSGVVLNRTAITQLVETIEHLKNVAVEHNKLQMYFTKLTSESTCIDLPFMQRFNIENRQSSYIRLYEYSRPETQLTTFYDLSPSTVNDL